MSLTDVVPGSEPRGAPDGDRIEVPGDEPVEGRWEGTLRNGAGREAVVLAATGRCLVFRSEEGRLGVLPREHVSAVESRVHTEAGYDGLDYRAVMGGGGAIAVVAFLGAILVPWSSLALVLVLAAVGGLWLIEHGWRNRETYDGFERVESEVEHVIVRSADGTSHEFVFPVEGAVGRRLVALVRERSEDRATDRGTIATTDS